MKISAKDHYEKLLAPVYAWMTGEMERGIEKFSLLLGSHARHGKNRLAADLGAGHGIQSVAMARHGYRVVAIDFSEYLLRELKTNCAGLPVSTAYDRLENFRSHISEKPHLVVCWGDTLTHLPDAETVNDLLDQIASALAPGGLVFLSFRNYTSEKPGTRKIIPVRSDESRHMTCILDYEESTVNVTDIIHERSENGWQMHHSSYKKLKLDPDEMIAKLEKQGLRIEQHSAENGVHLIVGGR